MNSTLIHSNWDFEFSFVIWKMLFPWFLLIILKKWLKLIKILWKFYWKFVAMWRWIILVRLVKLFTFLQTYTHIHVCVVINGSSCCSPSVSPCIHLFYCREVTFFLVSFICLHFRFLCFCFPIIFENGNFELFSKTQKYIQKMHFFRNSFRLLVCCFFY